MLLRAHEVLLGTKDLLMCISNLKSSDDSSSNGTKVSYVEEDLKQSFVELGSVWQAPLYEISLNYHLKAKPIEDSGQFRLQDYV